MVLAGHDSPPRDLAPLSRAPKMSGGSVALCAGHAGSRGRRTASAEGFERPAQGSP